MTATGVKDILLLDLPVLLWAEAKDRHDALVAALTERPGRDASAAPARFRAAVERLSGEFAEHVAPSELELRLAAERRIQQLDVALSVPAHARDDLAVLCDTYDQTEAYARRRKLIDSVAPGEVVKFRHWVIGQIVAQLDGAFPSPWSG